MNDFTAVCCRPPDWLQVKSCNHTPYAGSMIYRLDSCSGCQWRRQLWEYTRPQQGPENVCQVL